MESIEYSDNNVITMKNVLTQSCNDKMYDLEVIVLPLASVLSVFNVKDATTIMLTRMDRQAFIRVA